MRAAVVGVLIGLGVAVSLSGTVGILRLPDVYLRIQAAAKAVVLGALPMLAGLVVAKGPISQYGARALIVAGLLVIMNPIASHSLARAAAKSGIGMWPGAVLDQPAEREAARSKPQHRSAGHDSDEQHPDKQRPDKQHPTEQHPDKQRPDEQHGG